MNYKLNSTQQTFNTEIITGDTPVWNNVLYVMFDCKIEYDEFSKKLNEIYSENDLFRTSFFMNNGQIEQCISEFEYQEFECLLFDCKADLDAFSKKEADVPTLICENPLKTYIFKCENKIGCIFKIHHILFDGICESIIIDILKAKLGISNSENKIYSYEKNLIDDEAYACSPRYNRAIKYWNKKLEESFVNSIYEFDSSNDYSIKELWFEFDNQKISAAKEICKNANVPFSAFIYTAFALYVNKFIGLTDFSVGMPMINRMSNDDMHTLGLFMHILPLIIHINKESTLISTLENVYDEILELSKHQKFTQYDIKENCDFNNNNHFFDVVVNYYPKVLSSNCEQKSFRSSYSLTPLEFRFFDENDCSFSLDVLYRTTFFKEQDIKEIITQFKLIIDAFVKNPNVIIKDVSINSNYQIDSNDVELINKFNDTAYEYAIDEQSTLYSMFEKTAKENAEDICITANGKSITFGKLQNVSEALDCTIRSKTKEKSIVAVIADRSIEMYSAIYGIIRGGNAYLPIDPNYPQDRIDYILENSGAELVVAQGKYTSLVSNKDCIDLTEFIENTPVFNYVPPCNATEDDTAYVIYTSGSTGQPKGAKISHKSAVNRIAWMHEFYPLGKNGVILQKTPYTFDVSVWELFWWGMFGGKLAASKPNEHFVPEKILEEVEKNKVTHLHFVPSVFDVFLSYLEKNKDEVEKFNSVKHVFLSGEALTSNLIKRFYKIYDYENVKLHNLYGPTECAVDVTYYDCKPDDVDPVPIGKPIYNTEMFVLDENLQQLPIGVTGELHIGGVNVGQGYLNNEKLTNEKFITNPYGEGKLYKTGDLAYWREDGNIVYVGRNDFQVKVRGLRIELGEIENAINNIDGIEQSVVVVRKDNEDRQIICAFYTGEEQTTVEIKKAISANLPQYMLPNIFNYLAEIPLTTSGKIDRNKLMSYDIILDNTADESKELPETEFEKHICNLFAEILSIDNIYLDSDFYELGGNSIDLIRLLSYEEFESIKVADFMLDPTPKGLIKLLNNNDFKYLNALYLPSNAKRVLVLFPFAGGNASGYVTLENEFKKHNSNIALYYVDWCENEEEYIEIAKDIEDLSKRYEINFYSHCAGSAVAMKLLDILPENFVKLYIAGASIPLKKPLIQVNIWKMLPKRAILKYLNTVGFDGNLINGFVLDKMIHQFRTNTTECQQYFYNKSKITNANVISVVSKNDPFTRNYADADSMWNKIVSNYVNTVVLDTNSHYIDKTNVTQYYNVINKYLGDK